MFKGLRISVLMLLMLVVAGCHRGETVTGNGSKETVMRTVDQFQNIDFSGDYDIILIGQMPQKVAVTTDSNILPFLTTNVKSNTLYVSSAPNVSLTSKEPPMFEIYLPSLKGVKISGSGKVNATKIDADTLAIEISGSGRFNVSGKANKVSITISGSGEVNAQDLLVNQADINVSGAGRVSVNAQKELNAKVSGSGLIEYYGAPGKVTQDIAGSGKVIGISSNAEKNPA